MLNSIESMPKAWAPADSLEVLAMSERGPEVVACTNLVALHFPVSLANPVCGPLARGFVTRALAMRTAAPLPREPRDMDDEGEDTTCAASRVSMKMLLYRSSFTNWKLNFRKAQVTMADTQTVGKDGELQPLRWYAPNRLPVESRVYRPYVLLRPRKEEDHALDKYTSADMEIAMHDNVEKVRQEVEHKMRLEKERRVRVARHVAKRTGTKRLLLSPRSIDWLSGVGYGTMEHASGAVTSRGRLEATNRSHLPRISRSHNAPPSPDEEESEGHGDEGRGLGETEGGQTRWLHRRRSR